MASLLEIKKVSKFYRTEGGKVREALKDLSFDLREGEIFALLGVNGAGKTTLSSILATLHPPTSGDVVWQGASIYHNLAAYRKSVGYCAQKSALEKNLSLQEQLVFSGRCYGLDKAQAVERKDILLSQLSLESYANSYEHELSGGYQQRFLIARSLVHAPAIVILDEPTVGLDPHIRRQLWEVIANLRRQKITVVLTTHYLDEAEALADRVGLLHDGQLRSVDTPANLKKSHQRHSLEEVFLKFVEEQQ